MKQKLYLIRGVPGSGKSTLANDLGIALDAAGVSSWRVEADIYFYDDDGNYKFDARYLKEAHEWCQNATKGALSLGNTVIVSNTSTTEKEVAVYQQIAKEYGVEFVSIIVENRHDGKNVHNVPEEKIQQMKQRFSVKL